MRKIKFGLFLVTGDFAEARRLAEQADRDGFYSVSYNDHFFSPFRPSQGEQLECFTMLGALASITRNVMLGPLVSPVGFRSAALLAKAATTLDHISNGRLMMGVGGGWQRSEYDAHGYPYPSNSVRLDQLAEAIKVIKAMWTEAEPTFKGQWFTIDKAYNNPRPVQKPHPPLMVGGSGSKLLRIAAADADIINLIPPIFNGKDLINDPAAAVRFDKNELKRRVAKLRQFATEAGRGPDAVEIGGLTLVALSRDKSVADAKVHETASRMGYPSDEAARRSPSLLMGTVDEVRSEISSRIEELGMSYFAVLPDSDESYELFAKEVMPTLAG